MIATVDNYVLEPRFGENCWVIRAHEDPWAVVVDPGGDPTLLLEDGVETAAIFVTHADVDHIAGVAALARQSGAEVWMPADEADVLRQGHTRSAIDVEPYDPEHLVAGGETIAVAGLTFDVVDVPGHSAGHVAYHADGKLFSGDLLFARSVGRVDLEGGDWQTLLRSVQMLVDRFGPETEVYPGHGPVTTIGAELDSNPFLHELRARTQ